MTAPHHLRVAPVQAAGTGQVGPEQPGAWFRLRLTRLCLAGAGAAGPDLLWYQSCDRPGPDPAQAAPPLATLPHRAQRTVHPGRAQRAIWEHAARTAAGAARQIHHLAATDPAAAADAAWAAADTLHVAASALGSQVLRRAADAYDRVGRAPYGRIPRPSQAGNSLRRAAQLLSAATSVSGDPTYAQFVLIAQLAALAEAVADLRQAQRHAAQTAAARRAAEHLHAARAVRSTPVRGKSTMTRTAAERSRLEFPFPPGTYEPGSAVSPGRRTWASARGSPSHSPGSPRFESCDLTGAQFSKAQMEGTRFADCTLDGINGVTSLNGAIVKSRDALSLTYSLAGALGIIIEDG
jgi:hypothetical protein